jgi:hypothetical protein
MPLLLKSFERLVGTNPISGTVSIFEGKNVGKFVDDFGSDNLLLAKINLNTNGSDSRPRYSAAVEDRIYVPLEGEGSVAVIDAIGLKELDTKPATPIIDRINISGSKNPSYIVIGGSNRYAYVGDRSKGMIYVIDINPSSTAFNTCVKNIPIPDAGAVHRMAISQSGDFLFATCSNIDSDESEGKIVVINIDLTNTKKVHSVVDSVDTGLELEGIATTDNPGLMLFTNRKDDSNGLGMLYFDPKTGKHSADPKYIKMLLGSTNDEFDVNEAVDVVWMRDRATGDGYAFVAGRNGRLFGSGIPSIDGPRSGSNVGIVRFQEGKEPELIAATTPIAMGLTSSLRLSDGNQYLYVSQPGVGSTFVYDVLEIIKTLNNPSIASQLSILPIDQINPNIGIASNIRESDSTISDRPIGAGINWGLTSYGKAPVVIPVEIDIQALPGQEQNQRRVTFNWEIYDKDETDDSMNNALLSFRDYSIHLIRLLMRNLY